VSETVAPISSQTPRGRGFGGDGGRERRRVARDDGGDRGGPGPFARNAARRPTAGSVSAAFLGRRRKKYLNMVSLFTEKTIPGPFAKLFDREDDRADDDLDRRRAKRARRTTGGPIFATLIRDTAL
jgi:hypothetical protein